MVQVCVKLKGVLQEYAMIELQGDLESKQNLSLADNFVGDLHFTKDDTPVLIIGHHILYGKCVNLDKPLAMMKKSQSGGNQTDGSSQRPTEYLVQAVVKKKLIFKTRPKPIIVNMPKKI